MATETSVKTTAYSKAIRLSTLLGRLLYLDTEFEIINKVYGKNGQVTPHMADCLKETIRDLTVVKNELLKESRNDEV